MAVSYIQKQEDSFDDKIGGYVSVSLGGSIDTLLANLENAEAQVFTFTGFATLGSALVGKSGTCMGFGKRTTDNFDCLAISAGQYMALVRVYRTAHDGQQAGYVLRQWKNYT